MSDIIRFPQLVRSCALADSGLTEADEAGGNLKMSDLYGRATEATDATCALSGTNVTCLQQPDDSSAPTTGWSNQELADLYRTQRILALAGVTTQVDRGTTDEGDPWFVFMDSQGEVLVHFSRFDGFYLVTSHMQEAPIRGDSLQDLVAEFSRRVQPVAAAGTGENVISIAKRSRDVVFIHPAAALAALVWSIYLMADELIAATPMIAAGEAEGPDSSSPEKSAMSAFKEHADRAAASPSDALKPLPFSTDPEMSKQVGGALPHREGIAMGMSGQGAKAVGASLSLVALAVGLPLPAGNTLELSEDSGSPHKVSLDSPSATLKQAKVEEAALLTATKDIALHQRQIEAAEQLNEDVAAKALNIDPDQEVSVTVTALTPPSGLETESLSSPTSNPEDPPLPRNEPSVAANETAAPPREETPASSEGSASQEVGEASLLQSFDAAFDSFEIVSLDTIAQNELAQLLSADDVKEVALPLAPPLEAQGFETFNYEARVFLDFLLHTYDNIKVVNLPTEIIFIHMDAFEGNVSTQEIYAKSWTFDDGGTVSTIGFKSDMAEFDLIA